jgi:hypothetical protein
MDPSPSRRARAPTPTRSRPPRGRSAAERSTSTGSSPATTRSGSTLPGSGPSVRPGAEGRARGEAVAQSQGVAGRHALPRAVAQTHVSGRQVAACGGARALPGEQEKVAEYDTAASHQRTARWGDPDAAAAVDPAAIAGSDHPVAPPGRSRPRLWLARRWWGGRSCTAAGGRCRAGSRAGWSGIWNPVHHVPWPSFFSQSA